MREPLAVIVVPLTPSPTLSPNARVHWTKRAKAVSAARSVAAQATRDAISDDGRQRIAEYEHIGYRIQIAWEKGRSGMRDEDNALASCKAIIDGIADALGIDDRRLHIRGISFDRQSRTGVTIVTLLEDAE